MVPYLVSLLVTLLVFYVNPSYFQGGVCRMGDYVFLLVMYGFSNNAILHQQVMNCSFQQKLVFITNINQLFFFPVLLASVCSDIQHRLTFVFMIL